MIRLVLLTSIILIKSLSLNVQDKNELLDREFRKSDPSVSLIKKTIEDGNDPTQKATSSFDGFSYAIMDDASLESMKYMLTLEGNPLTKTTHGGLKYLQWVAYKVNIEVIKHLLALGADPYMPEEQQKEFFNGFAETLPVKQIGVAKDVTKSMLFFMENDYIMGAVLDIDGGQKLV